MNLDKIKDTARTTKDEIEGVLREHAELARRQYDEITDRHGDPVERVGETMGEPLQETREQVEELSRRVNEQTEGLALELAERTDRVGRVVNAEAERWGRELDERTREVREIVRDQFGFEPRIRTEPVSEARQGAAEATEDQPPTPPREDVQESSQKDEVPGDSEATDEMDGPS